MGQPVGCPIFVFEQQRKRISRKDEKNEPNQIGNIEYNYINLLSRVDFLNYIAFCLLSKRSLRI